jgi:hypothetical protein
VQYNLVGPECVFFCLLQSISVTQRSCKLMVLIKQKKSTRRPHWPLCSRTLPMLCNRAFTNFPPFFCLSFSCFVLARLVPPPFASALISTNNDIISKERSNGIW